MKISQPLKTFQHLFLAHLREFIREPMTVFWTFGFVIFYCLVFVLIYHRGTVSDVRVGLVSEKNNLSVTEFVQTALSVEGVEVGHFDREPAFEALRRNELDVVVLIQPRPESRAEGSHIESSAIDIYRIPSEGHSNVQAEAAESILRKAFLAQYSAQEFVQIRQLHLSGDRSSGPGSRFLPGLMTMFIIQLGLFGTAMPIISLRVQGVFRRMKAAPVSLGAFVAAPIAVRVLVISLQILLALVAGSFLFHLPMPMEISWMICLLLLASMCFIALGLFVASVAGSIESGNLLASALQIPFVFLAGIFFPLEKVPPFLRPLMTILPSFCLDDSLTQIVSGARPVQSIAVNSVLLFMWLILFGVLTIYCFRWE